MLFWKNQYAKINKIVKKCYITITVNGTVSEKGSFKRVWNRWEPGTVFHRKSPGSFHAEAELGLNAKLALSAESGVP